MNRNSFIGDQNKCHEPKCIVITSRELRGIGDDNLSYILIVDLGWL
jgi:hypothetical protein